MRREDRQMSKAFGLTVLDKARYGVLSLVTEKNEPYAIPLSFVRTGNTLYFHSAREGAKVALFKRNPSVAITFVGEVNVPENFTEEELEEIARDSEKVIMLLRSVFTTEFESAIVQGRVMLVHDAKERVAAMRLLAKKYTPTKMAYFPAAIQAGLGKANVYKVGIEKITAKRKKYDQYGEEMKWGRLE